jgi:hypothetical protein
MSGVDLIWAFRLRNENNAYLLNDEPLTDFAEMGLAFFDTPSNLDSAILSQVRAVSEGRMVVERCR